MLEIKETDIEDKVSNVFKVLYVLSLELIEVDATLNSKDISEYNKSVIKRYVDNFENNGFPYSVKQCLENLFDPKYKFERRLSNVSALNKDLVEQYIVIFKYISSFTPFVVDGVSVKIVNY